jgi:hypothetical protein
MKRLSRFEWDPPSNEPMLNGLIYGRIPLEPAPTEARPIPFAAPHASPDARRANDGASQYFVRVARPDAQRLSITRSKALAECAEQANPAAFRRGK